MGLKVGSQAINVTRERGLDLSGSGGASLAGVFTGSETFSAVLWAGDDRTAAATLSAAWDADITSNPAGVAKPRVKLTIAKSAIASCTPGIYYLQVVVNPGTDDIAVLPDGSTYELLPGPGSGVVGASYVTLDQCRKFVPWIDQAMTRHPSVQLDLAELRYEARCWVDEVALARARRILERQSLRHDPVVSVDPIEPTSGVDFGPAWGVSVYPDTTIRAQLEAIEDALSAGRLEKSPAVVRATAWRTAALACLPLLGEAEAKTSWQKLGERARAESSRILAATTLVIRGGSDDYELAP
jgi:hypothetical protein